MQRTENCKKFRINCIKDTIKSLEFICKALALDSKLIQIVSKSQP